MTEHVRLLPRNATPWMLATAEANDPLSTLGDDFDSIRLAFRNTPPQFMPFVVWQLGLGELSPYLPNLYDLVAEGVRWQRVRGTPAAISRGLSWLGYSARLEEEPTRRRRWHRFQIELDRVRDNDIPDLRRIDGIVSLSPPARSIFYRGFRSYDVRAAETSYKRLSRSMLSSHSGVRIDPGKAKWSFGRSYFGDAFLGQPELSALGTWIATVPEGDLWVDATYLWAGADFLWSYPAAQARRNAIYSAISAFPVYVRFSDSGGVIGYRKAFMRPCRVDSAGQYQIGSTVWGVSEDYLSAAVVSCRTGFGDGNGRTATTMAVVFGPTIIPGVKPGALWLTPAQASGGHAFASTPVTIPFGLTVRELCRFSLRF